MWDEVEIFYGNKSQNKCLFSCAAGIRHLSYEYVYIAQTYFEMYYSLCLDDFWLVVALQAKAFRLLFKNRHNTILLIRAPMAVLT